MPLRRIDDPRDRKPQSKQRINEMIRVPQVRVISDEGTQLGVMSTYEALNTARQSGLDLVEVASDSKPPVCRIMDYGKFLYQQKKKQTKQNVHQTKLKEVRFRPKTGEHDLQVKLNQAKEFLHHKDKVQVTVIFNGRELAHIDEGEKVLERVLQELDEFAKVESPAKRAGKRIVCTLAPR
jgi:translation initiation factor IF-3